MAKSKKEKIPFIITPRVYAMYAWLNKPDTQFAKEGEAKYKITFLIDKEDIGEGRLNWGSEPVDGKTWMKHIMALTKAAGGTPKVGGAGCPVKDGDEKKLEDGSPNEAFAGKYYVTAKSGFPPRVVDTKDQPLPGDMTVYSGDLVKVALEPNNWKSALGAGLNFYCSKVMLIEKGERKDGINMGEEEGFVAPAGNPNLDFGGDDEDDGGEDF